MANLGHEENGGELAFEITDVGIDVFGDIFDGLVFDVGAHELSFGAEDGAFVFKFWELEVKSNTLSKT